MAALAAAVPIISALTSVAGLFMNKKSSSAPPTPAIAPPTVMPTPDDDAMKKAKRRSVAEQLARSGRASTILSDDSGGLLGA